MNYTGEEFSYNSANLKVNSDLQLANILDKFNYEYISDVIDSSLENIFIQKSQLPNVVYGYEINFNNLLDGFTGNADEIQLKRYNIYTDIINKVCDFYNLEFTGNLESMDIYTVAYSLYDFFVSNFFDNMIRFFTMYIVYERDNIMNNFKEIRTMKKDNENIVQYSKQLFKNESLAYIYSNIEYVISNITTFDIPLQDIINYTATDRVLGEFLSSILLDKRNFFRDKYCSFILNENFVADNIIAIKSELQKIGSSFE